MRDFARAVCWLPPGAMSQMRDLTENDNMTPAMMRQLAQDMRAWAKSRENMPAWREMADKMKWEAALMEQQANTRGER